MSDGGRLCSICGGPHYAGGYCEKHWRRVKRAQARGKILTKEQLLAAATDVLTVSEAKRALIAAAIELGNVDSEDDIAYAEAEAAFWRSHRRVQLAEIYEARHKSAINKLAHSRGITHEVAACALRDDRAAQSGGATHSKVTPEILAKIHALHAEGLGSTMISRAIGGVVQDCQVNRILRGIHGKAPAGRRQKRIRQRTSHAGQGTQKGSYAQPLTESEEP